MKHKILQEADLIPFIRRIIEQNIQMRDKYCVDYKFDFVYERLASLLRRLETEIEIKPEAQRNFIYQPAADETVVYVYLFNAQGLHIKQWLNMLKAGVFYEYSINRPVYAERSHVEALLRTKPNKVQHGFIEIAVNKEDILPQKQVVSDINHHPLLKVREGSLKIDKVISFLHNDIVYRLTDKGLEIKT